MPLSPTATRTLLAELGHNPRHFLGQNFLVDGNIVRKSLALAEIQPRDTVVEIGPGLGTLTAALLEAGADVWAVELDRTLHDYLAKTLGPKFPASLHLMLGDAVEHPLAGFKGAGPLVLKSAADLRTRGPASFSGGLEPFKIVANLPYAISTPWLDAVLAGPLPVRMVLMLQQEAAQRYAAAPGGKSFGAISVFLQAAYDVAPGHTVAAACFHPRPDVASRLLHLVRKPLPTVFPESAKVFIRRCFQQRRKQIGALLRGRLADDGAAWREQLHSVGLSLQTRPEAIPVAQWAQLVPLLAAGA